MGRRVETRVAVQCDRGCVMTARRAVSIAAVVAGVALVSAPMVLPAAGVTPPPMPAATPTGDWVPGWTPGADAPDGQARTPGADRTSGPSSLPQTGAGPEVLAVLAAASLLAGGGWLAIRGWRR